MKKNLLIACMSLCIIPFGNTVQAQIASDSMEINTLKVGMVPDGGIWGITTNDSGTYKPLIYAQSLWIGGLDVGNNLKTSALTYRQRTPNFFAGPVSNNPNATTKYDKVYRVAASTISAFVNGSFPIIPSEIADWPAHGDTTQGEADYLAPFVDVDNDGRYNPQNGDYPDIKGDEAMYTIFNDINDRPADGMGLEIHLMAYAYNVGGGYQDSVLYLDYTVFNRTTNAYSDVFMGSFTDFDLGNATDDLIGTNINQDAVFVYNGDSDDEGPSGFGTNLAACGLRILQGPPADYFDGVDNDRDGCIDGIRVNGACQPENPAAGIRENYVMSNSMGYNNGGANTNISDPSMPMHYYNYLQSKWKNGNDLVLENPSGFLSAANGDGYTSNGAGTKVAHIFPGNSFDSVTVFGSSSPNNWFASPTKVADTRALANMGPFSIAPNQSFEVKLGIVWTRSNSQQGSFDDINNSLSGLSDSKPKRFVNIPTHQLPQKNIDLFFAIESQGWVLHNKSNKAASFILVNGSGQKIKHITAKADAKTEVNRDGLPAGVYLLVDEQSGQSFKVQY